MIVKSGRGTIIKLDEHRLKNITYIGLVIRYDGGPLVLENVSFIDCEFQLNNNQKTREFGGAVFAYMPVSFTSKAEKHS